MAGAESLGKIVVDERGTNKRAGRFNDAVATDDEGAVDARKLLDGFIERRIEDIAHVLGVAAERIDDELLGVFRDLDGVSDDEEGPDWFAFASFGGERQGNAERSLEYGTADVLRVGYAVIDDAGQVELIADGHDVQGINQLTLLPDDKDGDIAFGEDVLAHGQEDCQVDLAGAIEFNTGDIEHEQTGFAIEETGGALSVIVITCHQDGIRRNGAVVGQAVDIGQHSGRAVLPGQLLGLLEEGSCELVEVEHGVLGLRRPTKASNHDRIVSRQMADGRARQRPRTASPVRYGIVRVGRMLTILRLLKEPELMFAILTSFGLTVLTTVSPHRLYYQVNRPFEVDVSSGTARQLVLMTASNEEIARSAIPDGVTTADLQDLFPKIWELTTTHYLQQVTEGTPDGPALTLQPLVTPPTPVLRYQTMGGQRVPRVEGWQKPGPAERLMSGFRVYREQYAVLHTTLGDIKLVLRPDEAPNTAWNFRHLVEGGFYTDIPFHRIVARAGNGHPFVIQAGDPTGTGSGGCAYNIDLEASTIPHDLGVISMAREGGDVNTNSSQFFICLSREGTSYLDVQYTSFGQTIGGIDVVTTLGAVKVGPGDRPIEMPYITSAELVDGASRTPGEVPFWMPRTTREPAEEGQGQASASEDDVDPGR